ncbi:hypothetical protein AB9K26_14765 [Psychroserpens sp. XS_ASV72]
MKLSNQVIIYLILAAITMYGIISGKFLFLVLLIPLGFGWFKNDKD